MRDCQPLYSKMHISLDWITGPVRLLSVLLFVLLCFEVKPCDLLLQLWFSRVSVYCDMQFDIHCFQLRHSDCWVAFRAKSWEYIVAVLKIDTCPLSTTLAYLWGIHFLGVVESEKEFSVVNFMIERLCFSFQLGELTQN